MQLWLCPLLAFLLGSIPFGLLMAKAKGIDIRAHGSGNIGATNVLRVMGKNTASPVCCWMLKGFIPVAIAVNLIQITGRPVQVPLELPEAWVMELSAGDALKAQIAHILTALAAVLGHNYSPWVGFKGGKGIATSAGVLFGLMPFAVLMLLVVWLLAVSHHPLCLGGQHGSGLRAAAAHAVGLLASRAHPGRHMEQAAFRLHRHHRRARRMETPRQHPAPARGHRKPL
jgi:acyl-phosphate glycerol 3-phosphate acyltransferase